ncbi:MAG: hypothetical protein QN183_00580 [Armatimonadota bacterium]|nr:hypothetical protein [Armatimonadota bacterium]MDR7534844.1 hypothetical protein [Armatimonadota bacterium]
MGCGGGPRRARRCAALAVSLAVAVAGAIPARAGHELAYSPAFYPHEIQIETAGADAAERLRQGALHALVGLDPFAPGPLPADVAAVESLRAYVLVTADGPALAGVSREARCRVLGAALGVLARSTRFHFHPYPVTPFHEDYLHHADLARAQHVQYAAGEAAGRAPRFRPHGPLAAAILADSAGTAPGGVPWDVTVETVPVEELVAASAPRLDGGQGPPWARDGWFHAVQLLRGRVDDAEGRAADEVVARLVAGTIRRPEERVALEREVPTQLLRACRAAVAGYVVRREPYNTEFSAGVENVAFDAHSGLNAPIFIRTVKLKDFPWNGVLRLGVAAAPQTAWNPVGGFTDPFGRLVWAAVGDPALLPAPYGAGAVPNRVVPHRAEPPRLVQRLDRWIARLAGGEVRIPRDARLPDAAGRWHPVGWRATAQARVTYTVRTSAFHDGTTMTAADALYPFLVAYRWGVAGPYHDPRLAAATALVRAHLAGVRLARIEETTLRLGDLRLQWRDPVIEVYLRGGLPAAGHIAALAPPWAPVPWHVMYLMEEAVRRGLAAFSAEEARRRGIPQLDLVRAPAQVARLRALAAELEARGAIPAGLEPYVTAQEARLRWRALQRFAERTGHLLVTAGPYRLARWDGRRATLTVFRDLTYPLVIGAYDRYALPRPAHIAALRVAGGQLRVRAEVELVERVQRDHRITREALSDEMLRGTPRVRPVCRFVVVDAAGRVLQVGEAAYAGGGEFAAALRAAGPATVMVALYQDENFVAPGIRTLALPSGR